MATHQVPAALGEGPSGLTLACLLAVGPLAGRSLRLPEPPLRATRPAGLVWRLLAVAFEQNRAPPPSTGGQEWVLAVFMQCLLMVNRRQEPAVTWGGWLGVGLGQWIWGASSLQLPGSPWRVSDCGKFTSLLQIPHPGPFLIGWRVSHNLRPSGLSSRVRLGTHPLVQLRKWDLPWTHLLPALSLSTHHPFSLAPSSRCQLPPTPTALPSG